MNSRTKTLLTIAAALLTILGCGYGLGSAFSPRQSKPKPLEVSIGNFEAATLTNLAEALNLTSAQEEAILSDLNETSDRIRDARREALLKYHLQILDLHDKIAPKLDPAQQAILQKNRQLLQDTIEKGFEKSLHDLRSSLESGD